jgi:hypothetical protein
MKKMFGLLMAGALFSSVSIAQVTLTSANFNSYAQALENQRLSTGNNVQFRDIVADRGDGTGVIYLGSSGGAYLHWDGVGNYYLGSGNKALHSANFNSYAPTLTGTGASGNWNINITGISTYWGNSTAALPADFSTIVHTIPDYLLAAYSGIAKPISTVGLRSFLNIPAGGETLQSVMERGNATNTGMSVRNGSELGICSGSFANGDASLSMKASGTNSTSGYVDVQSYYSGIGYNTPLVFNQLGGNVGIGTTSPVCKLDVAGDANFSRGQGTQLFIQTPDTDVRLYTVGKPLLIPEGNVGIGTFTPTQKLSVNGTVLAKKVKISQTPADWPDYVFDSSYQLTPLYQVEKYIQQNKHLPDVPSAAAVKKDGVDLGDNQAVLLKKIEELTLYIIEQHKELKSLAQEVKALKENKK